MLVKEVVERVERMIVLNFGGHWRSPELAAAGKNVFVGNLLRCLME